MIIISIIIILLFIIISLFRFIIWFYYSLILMPSFNKRIFAVALSVYCVNVF